MLPKQKFQFPAELKVFLPERLALNLKMEMIVCFGNMIELFLKNTVGLTRASDQGCESQYKNKRFYPGCIASEVNRTIDYQLKSSPEHPEQISELDHHFVQSCSFRPWLVFQ